MLLVAQQVQTMSTNRRIREKDEEEENKKQKKENPEQEEFEDGLVEQTLEDEEEDFQEAHQ